MMCSQPFIDRGALISFTVAALVAAIVQFAVQPSQAWMPLAAFILAFFVTAAVLNLRGKK